MSNIFPADSYTYMLWLTKVHSMQREKEKSILSCGGNLLCSISFIFLYLDTRFLLCFLGFLRNLRCMAGNVDHQMAASPEDLSSIPWGHNVEGENEFHNLSSDLYILC